MFRIDLIKSADIFGGHNHNVCGYRMETSFQMKITFDRSHKIERDFDHQTFKQFYIRLPFVI